MTEEEKRLRQERAEVDWKIWGPYLAERAWGTVREDYSADGSAWDFFPHDHARSRAYRWNEDGLLGISDRRQILCFAVAMWNGKDSILKERFFGLTGPQGNHGEDVKEYFYYLDSTPTHSYMKRFTSIRRLHFRMNNWWPRTDGAAAMIRSLNSSTPACLSRTDILMCRWSTRRMTLKIF